MQITLNNITYVAGIHDASVYFTIVSQTRSHKDLEVSYNGRIISRVKCASCPEVNSTVFLRGSDESHNNNVVFYRCDNLDKTRLYIEELTRAIAKWDAKCDGVDLKDGTSFVGNVNKEG